MGDLQCTKVWSYPSPIVQCENDPPFWYIRTLPGTKSVRYTCWKNKCTVLIMPKLSNRNWTAQVVALVYLWWHKAGFFEAKGTTSALFQINEWQWQLILLHRLKRMMVNQYHDETVYGCWNTISGMVWLIALEGNGTVFPQVGDQNTKTQVRHGRYKRMHLELT